MGTNYYVVSSKPKVCYPIHIGKSSAGWKFLFHSVNVYDNYISDDPLNNFPQWKKFLEDFNRPLLKSLRHNGMICIGHTTSSD